MYMAQIVGGHEGVKFTLKGIEPLNETGETGNRFRLPCTALAEILHDRS